MIFDTKEILRYKSLYEFLLVFVRYLI